MALVKAKVSIEGVQPLLWHHFGPDAIPLGAKEKSGKAGNDPDEWRKTVLATESGQLYLRREYVFGCLRAAAKFTTLRRRMRETIAAVWRLPAVRRPESG